MSAAAQSGQCVRGRSGAEHLFSILAPPPLASEAGAASGSLRVTWSDTNKEDGVNGGKHWPAS